MGQKLIGSVSITYLRLQCKSTIVQRRTSYSMLITWDATERNQLKMKRSTAAREQQVKAVCFDVKLLSVGKERRDNEMLGWKKRLNLNDCRSEF